MTTNMRKSWFEHVAKTRKKLCRTNKDTTHREAMTAASVTWAAEKVKIMNRNRRAERKAEKEAKKNNKPEEKEN